MKNIEVSILNPWAVSDAEKMMVAMARLTQRGEKISNMEDFYGLLNKEYTDGLIATMTSLPHPTIQKFSVINIAIVGASRRFLAQITRHQKEVIFMSGSLQYSDYSDKAQFVVPYEIIEADNNDVKVRGIKASTVYIDSCFNALDTYKELEKAVGRDAAGYAMPQGMRNVLLISATPYQWKHMISQRICRRNTLETRYVMLRVWEELLKYSDMFRNCGADCMANTEIRQCREGKMTCKYPIDARNPSDILDLDFELLRGK